jgi:hypothetical protein
MTQPLPRRPGRDPAAYGESMRRCMTESKVSGSPGAAVAVLSAEALVKYSNEYLINASQVLDVGCGVATTAIETACRYGAWSWVTAQVMSWRAVMTAPAAARAAAQAAKTRPPCHGGRRRTPAWLAWVSPSAATPGR